MNIKNWFSANRDNLLALALFLLICFAYFSPVLEGRKIVQGDIKLLTGFNKEVLDYKEKTGDAILWTNNLFGGMPTYQIWVSYPYNIASHIVRTYNKILPNPIHLAFIYFAGFFMLLRVCRVNIPLSIIGSMAFAFSSYNFIILEAGHLNKAEVIGLFAPVAASVMLIFRGRYWSGGILTALFLAMGIAANHLQMTYYLALAVILYVLVQAAYVIKNKTGIAPFLRSCVVLLLAVIVGIGMNASSLMLNYEYAEETIRGNTELRLNPEANPKGLDKSYAFQYSYGIAETFTLLVPNFYGGSTQEKLSQKSETYETLRDKGIPNAGQIIKQFPTYWGDLPITSGPLYFGAIVIFLFILGLFILKGPEKWWCLIVAVLSVMLSWGKYFEPLSDFFFNYFPLYNKFRAVSSILVLASFVIPFLAILTVREIVEGRIEQASLMKALKRTVLIIGAFLLVCMAVPDIFGDFTNDNDKQLPEWLLGPVMSDRQDMLRMDAFRSLAFILLAAGAIYLYVKQKIKLTYLYVALGIFILADMWTVDKRYVNNDAFLSRSKSKAPYKPAPTQANLQILQDPDPYFRVFNVSVNPFVDNSTSFFHKSLGGYHAAKLKRYQEIIEYHLSKNNVQVMNMLNTKYFIVKPEGMPEPMAQLNPGACGNAWFIKEIRYVANADSEMTALNKFDPKATAIIDQRYKDKMAGLTIIPDSAASIKLTNYHPERMVYKSAASSEQFAVFSEIYYSKGWDAYIDGKQVDYIRVNYLLRGLRVPAGDHEIIFKFEPETFAIGKKIDLAFSVILILAFAGGIYLNRRKSQQQLQES